MGCDGGTIPRRDEMVKLKKKAEKAGKDEELAARWRHCALSGEELRTPIVACELGRLYNKEALLMALLDRANMPEIVRHIRSLKDVVELKLTPNPSYKPSYKADTYNDVQAAEFVCPVSGLEMSGRYKFIFLRGCGCVLSEKTLKEVPSENCHKCGCQFTGGDVVLINGGEEEVGRLREAMEERRRQAKLAKRKRKAESSPEEATSSSSPPESGSDKDSPPAEKRLKLPDGTPASGPASSTSTSKKQPTASKTSSKLLRSSTSKASSKSASSSSSGSKLNTMSTASAVARKTTEAMTSSYKKVADDPSARTAYKSLFNSGAKERPKEHTSHWVTFFPYH